MGRIPGVCRSTRFRPFSTRSRFRHCRRYGFRARRKTWTAGRLAGAARSRRDRHACLSKVPSVEREKKKRSPLSSHLFPRLANSVLRKKKVRAVARSMAATTETLSFPATAFFSLVAKRLLTQWHAFSRRRLVHPRGSKRSRCSLVLQNDVSKTQGKEDAQRRPFCPFFFPCEAHAAPSPTLRVRHRSMSLP